MYFTFQCSHCGKDLKARADNAGASVRCPYCHTVIKVPAAPAAAAAAAARSAPPPLPAARSGQEPQAAESAAAQPKPSGGKGASGAASAASAIAAKAAEKRPAAVKAAAGAASAGAAEDMGDNTNVSMLWTALAGAALSVVFFAALVPLRGRYLSDVFLARGWVPFVEVFFMFWSVAILALKARKLRRQRETMLLDVLPGTAGEPIAPENLDRYSEHISTLPVAAGQSFLVNRVWRGLEHFRLRRSQPEVASMLASQSDIDATAVASSYTILNTFIWAIPILGFIGTVQGLGNAVGGFAGGLDQAQDINVLKESLSNITLGLGVAFDTTLIALIMSLFLMLPTKSIQKAEEDLLNWITEYCNENLLKRLSDGGPPAEESGPGTSLREAIDAAMAPHHAELQAWTKRLETIGGAISDQVASGWKNVHQQIGPLLEQLGRLQQEAARLQQDFVGAMNSATLNLQSQAGRHQQDLLAGFQSAASQMQSETGRIRQELVAAFQGAAGGAEIQLRSLQQCAEQHQARIEEGVGRMVDQIQQAMSGLAVRTAGVQDEVMISLRSTADSIQASLGGLGRGIDELSAVLQRLGSQHVVVQVSTPPRRRWWSFSRQRDGGIQGGQG